MKHKSVKFVVIDDESVIIVSALAKLLVVGYIIYAMIWEKQYMAVEDAIGTLNIYGSGFTGENSVQGLCNSSKYDFIYGGGWEYTNLKCRHFDYGEVMRKIPGGGLYITTFSQDYTASLASDGTTNGTSGNFFVEGVDDIEVYIEHGYRTVSGRSDTLSRAKVLDQQGKEYRTFDAGETVHLPLAELLQISGISSLDKENKKTGVGIKGEMSGTPHFRLTGVAINVDIEYTTMGMHSYSGDENMAILTFTQGNTAWNGAGGSTDYTVGAGHLGAYNLNGYYSYGVTILVNVGGTIGTPDMLAFFSNAAKFIVYIGCAHLLADFIMMHVSPLRHSHAKAKHTYDTCKMLEDPNAKFLNEEHKTKESAAPKLGREDGVGETEGSDHDLEEGGAMELPPISSEDVAPRSSDEGVEKEIIEKLPPISSEDVAPRSSDEGVEKEIIEK